MSDPENPVLLQDEGKQDTPTAVVGRIAFALCRESFGTGPLAALRRLDPGGTLVEPALHRLLAHHVPAESLKDRESVCDWALIIHCLALAAPGQLDHEARLGRMLQHTGVKEQRFTRLLQATPQDLRDVLPRAVRFLVHQSGRLDGTGVARLVLSARSAAWGERVRQQLAHDYYRAEYEAAAAAL